MSKPFADDLVEKVFGREPTEHEKKALHHHLYLGFMVAAVALKYAAREEVWQDFAMYAAQGDGGPMPVTLDEAIKAATAFGCYARFIVENRMPEELFNA